MHDLERRAYHLLRDWKALRHRLEQVHHEQCLGQFYTMRLEDIEASLVELPELVDCIVGETSSLGETNSLSATTRSQTYTPQQSNRGGLAAVIRRTRHADD
jgi:hypothetical protein